MTVDRKFINDIDLQDTYKAKNAPDPTDDQDYATKKYVDDNAGSGFVPDPSGEPDDKWLKTSSGTLIYTDPPAADVAGDTHAASSKNPPVDADELPLVDSAASFVLKKLTWANLKATLKTYFDTLYQAAGVPASLTYSENFLTGDVTMTNANTYYDGPSLTLAAGTWLLLGQVLCVVTGTATSKLWDGTNIFASAEQSSPGTAASVMFPYSKVVVLSGSTTVKISVRGNIAGSVIKYRAVVDTADVNATGLTALKVA